MLAKVLGDFVDKDLGLGAEKFMFGGGEHESQVAGLLGEFLAEVGRVGVSGWAADCQVGQKAGEVGQVAQSCEEEICSKSHGREGNVVGWA